MELINFFSVCVILAENDFPLAHLKLTSVHDQKSAIPIEKFAHVLHVMDRLSRENLPKSLKLRLATGACRDECLP